MAMHVLLLAHGKSFRFVGACARTIIIVIIILTLKKNANVYVFFVARTQEIVSFRWCVRAHYCHHYHHHRHEVRIDCVGNDSAGNDPAFLMVILV